MATLMKALALLVVGGGLIVFMILQRQIPSSQKLNFFLSMVPAVVFVSALYFALGHVLEKLDWIMRSLERPQIGPPRAVAAGRSPAEQALADETGPAARNEPAL